MTETTNPQVKAAIWARVSTSDQHTANQLDALRKVAAQRGYLVTAEFVTEDSAWSKGGPSNGKGAAFDKARTALLSGAHKGEYTVVLVWALDRLSRRGYDDLRAVMSQLAADGCELWSDQEPWLHTLGPVGEIIVHVIAWVAQQESQRRSERIKAGLERRKAQGKPVGRKPGATDRKPRRRSGYVASWEEDGARRQALVDLAVAASSTDPEGAAALLSEAASDMATAAELAALEEDYYREPDESEARDD